MTTCSLAVRFRSIAWLAAGAVFATWAAVKFGFEGPAAAAEPAAAVRLVKQAEAVQVYVGDQLFTEYRIAPSQPKPYFYPVLSASGKPITRQMPISTGEDHPHQKSIWLAIDEVNEVDFWAEKGKIVNRSVEIVEPQGDPAVFQARNEWQDATGKTVVTETTTVRVFSSRLMAFEFTFSAGDDPVTFGDTKEGLFGVRVNTQLREDKGTGRITNADGQATEKNCWSKESAWVDYSGKVDGAAVGVTIFDHPKNLRRSRWHVRGYGLFSVNPFGGKAYTRDPKNDGTHRLDAKRSLTLRYGLYVHEGDAKQAGVADAYAKYAAGG